MCVYVYVRVYLENVDLVLQVARVVDIELRGVDDFDGAALLGLAVHTHEHLAEGTLAQLCVCVYGCVCECVNVCVYVRACVKR